MSAGLQGRAELISHRVGEETSLGVPPTSGFQQIQVNQGGTTKFQLDMSTVAPSPVSSLRQNEKSQVVDGDAKPGLAMNLTCDHWRVFGSGSLLAAPANNGGTGTARFVPTARTTSAYTVAAGGALQAGTLVRARGWANAANNGIFVVGSSSNGTSIPVGGGVAETPSGYLATLEVIGFRGASDDIQIDSSGNIISTIADLSSMGLVVGQAIWAGGVVGGAHAFPLYTGFTRITAIAATKLTTSAATRQWTQAGADVAAGKTADIYFGSWLRNVDELSASWSETSYAIELQIPRIGAAGVTNYRVATGCMVSTLEIASALKALTTMTLAFSGSTVSLPSASRITGPSTAQIPFLTECFSPADRTYYIRFTDSATGALLVGNASVQSWKLMINNNVSPLKGQGVLGTVSQNIGKLDVTVEAEVLVDRTDAIAAAQQQGDVTFGVGLYSGDGGLFFEVPAGRIEPSDVTFPANGPIQMSLKFKGALDSATNSTMGVTYFPYLPPPA